METCLERQPWSDPRSADSRYVIAGFKAGASGAEINVLELAGGRYEVQGLAVWVNPTVKPPSAHTGNFRQTIASDGLVFRIREGARVVTIERQGTVLRVQDNDACGGVNVTFSGECQRVGHPALLGG